MIAKIFGWVMMVINILFVLGVLITSPDMFFWILFVFCGETYISAKYLESLK